MELDSTERSSAGISAISTDEAEALAEYRSVSLLALLGLAMGLASPLVFVADLLMAVPLFGAAISVLALIKIHAGEGRLVGRNLALIGLVLAIASACAAPSRARAIQYLLSRQARPVAEQWFQYLSDNELEQAFLLTTDAVKRNNSSSQPALPGMESIPPFDGFQSAEVVELLCRFGEHAAVEFDKTIFCERLPNRNRVLQLYRVTSDSEVANAKPLEVGLVLEQSTAENHHSPWRIDSYNQQPL